jgi:two-component system sensor histidine kinase KdpD
MAACRRGAAAYHRAVSRRRLLRLALPVGSAILAVGAATVVVIALEGEPGVPNASAVYLVAVAAVAIAVGTAGAILTAVLAVLTYDFLFTDPLHTLIVADPGEWLNLVVLLFVAVTVGELAEPAVGREPAPGSDAGAFADGVPGERAGAAAAGGAG